MPVTGLNRNRNRKEKIPTPRTVQPQTACPTLASSIGNKRGTFLKIQFLLVLMTSVVKNKQNRLSLSYPNFWLLIRI